MSTADLGPLPQSDDNAKLQRASIKALNGFLQGHDDLIFRDERVEDYGVDGSLELEINGGVTNFRSQVQMKATGSISTNNDGSVSLSVETYNLNYLLNGPSPVYVLYDAVGKEFWYVWAHDEQRRLQASNPDWAKQEHITLRFVEKLTKAALDGIRERILSEGRLHRQIHDVLARSTISDQVVISIDKASLQIEDSNTAANVLLASGPALVAAGFPQEVIRLLGILAPEVREFPRIQLTAAYAHYMVGKHQLALGHIANALIAKTPLEPKDQAFVQGLRDGCEFRIGLIDTTTYKERSGKRAAQLQGVEALEAQLEQVRYELLRERDRTRRGQMVARLHEIVEKVDSSRDATAAMKLSAKVAALYVEGTEATMAAMVQLALVRIRQNVGVASPEMAQESASIFSRLAAWESSANDALKQAYELKHPILIGDALTLRLSVQIFQLVNKRCDAIGSGQTYKMPSQVMQSISQMTDQAIAIYDLAGSVEGSLTIKMFKADLLEIAGDIAGAKQIAAEVRPIANAMSFVSLASRAADLFEDKTTLMEFEREWAAFVATDHDIAFSKMTDDQLREFAKDTLQAYGTPMTRIGIAERYMFEQRQVAQERVQWCRHLQVLDDTESTDPASLFLVAPKRKCVCEKHRYQTQIITSDLQGVMGAMKQNHCTGCQDRQPKTQ